MHIISDRSIVSEVAIENFQHYLKFNLNILIQKLKLCSYYVYIISPDTSRTIMKCQVNDQKFDFLVKEIKESWHFIRGFQSVIPFLQKSSWKKIDQIGNKIFVTDPKRSSMYLRRFRNPPDRNTFFILLRGDEPFGLPIFELNLLCNLWQLEQCNIPLHSAGIVHNQNLFLFGGRSGVGKSTVSNLSSEQGDWLLDEDQVLIKPDNSGGYVARAWGYSLQTSGAPLRAVLKLVKATEDLLIPLSQHKTAGFLFERNIDVMGNMLETEHIEHVFRQVSSIARQIPGYELHFRKSPDFWKLIDLEFPNLPL